MRIHRFGDPDVITLDEIEVPRPGRGEVLVRVHAAGVGPWDAWVRAGRSVLPQPLPLTLGSDLAGEVIEIGPEVDGISSGLPIFGVTNARFTDAYADYAIARAGMIARAPTTLSHALAASVPVVAVTARQMLVDHAGVRAGQRVLVLGAGGNVGAYAVQLARRAGAHVIAADRGASAAYAAELGAHEVIDTAVTALERAAASVEIVIDAVGGELAARALAMLVPGGMLVSSVAKPTVERVDVHARFMLVDVTAAALAEIAAELDAGHLVARVGTTLPLADARRAHEMLAGQVPHAPGKIVLEVDAQAS